MYSHHLAAWQYTDLQWEIGFWSLYKLMAQERNIICNNYNYDVLFCFRCSLNIEQ